MKERKLSIGLLVLVVFAGGCVLTPYDPEEEEVNSVSSEVSTAQPQDTEGATNDPLTPSNPVTAGQSAPSPVDTRLSNDPTKPQPDPWDGMRWRSLNSSSR